MSKCTMDEYTLQSYFKSLCNSCYIAYKQLVRLEEEMDELNSTCPDEELEMVKSCLQVYKSEEWQQKYIMQKYSKEELEKRKEELELAEKEYDEKCEKLDRPKQIWSNLFWKNVKNIAEILAIIKENYFSIIVTSKEEVIALMAFFKDHDLSNYRIINTDEQYLRSFPTGEKMYEDFYAAYCLNDDDEMKKVIQRYF